MNKINKSCFFIGHRDSPEVVKPLLLDHIQKHIIEYGVTKFYVGHYGQFDAMVISALSDMKKRYPHIENSLLLAYHPAVRSVTKPDGFDDTLLIDGQEKAPPRFAITRLNRQMINDVDYLIAYVRVVTDGSHKLFDTAKAKAKKGKLVITNLAELL